MWKRKLLITALMGAGLIGGLTYDEYQASRPDNTSWLLTTIGVPFCAPQRAGPQYKTFFRLAMAQAESANKPAKTEVGPFSKAIPSAESIANADANPVLVDDLGTLHYTITTSVPLAQKFFDQGLRLTYAFNHGEALRAYRKARTLDPGCAMCYWGEALVLGPNINAPMDAASGAPAFDAVSKAKAISGKASAKERALIDALTARYGQDAPADRAALDTAYADAMQKVAARYPSDDQIAVLYAESLMDLQPWDYWEAAGAQPKGRTEEIVGLLEKVLARAPNHPGAIHYYIHLTEASSDPKRAVPYARRLGRLMPGAGHVVHMPFHTFFRVGMYKEAVEANRLAVKVDEAYIARSHADRHLPAGLLPSQRPLAHGIRTDGRRGRDRHRVRQQAGADRVRRVGEGHRLGATNQGRTVLCPRTVQRREDHSRLGRSRVGLSLRAGDVALRARGGIGQRGRCDCCASRGRCHRAAPAGE